MKRTLTLTAATLAALTLAACGGGDPAPASKAKTTKPSTAQAKDAWLVYRMDSLETIDAGNYCQVAGTLENRSDVPVHAANIVFTPVFSDAAIDSAKKYPGASRTQFGPANWADANSKPLQPGETRPVMGRLEWQCDWYEGLTLTSANGTASDGTNNTVADGFRLKADSVILENNTRLAVGR